MSEEFQKAARDGDLISACISALGAAVLLSYVVNVAKPGVIHVLIAIVAVAAIVGAYLYVAHAKVDAAWKAATIIIGGALGVACLRFSSLLF